LLGQREIHRLVTDVESGGEMVMAELFEKWLHLAEDERSPTTFGEQRRLVAKRMNPAIGDTPITKAPVCAARPASLRQMNSIIRR
jgi:hypothetical protein